jgi:hypothetical protein
VRFGRETHIRDLRAYESRSLHCLLSACEGLFNTAQVQLEESRKAERLRIVGWIQNRGLQRETLPMIFRVRAYSFFKMTLSQNALYAENEQGAELGRPRLRRGNRFGAGPDQQHEKHGQYSPGQRQQEGSDWHIASLTFARPFQHHRPGRGIQTSRYTNMFCCDCQFRSLVTFCRKSPPRAVQNCTFSAVFCGTLVRESH